MSCILSECYFKGCETVWSATSLLLVNLQVQTPEEEDGSSTPHADSPRLSPRLEVSCAVHCLAVYAFESSHQTLVVIVLIVPLLVQGDEGGIRRIKGPGGVPPGHDGTKKAPSSGGLFGKVLLVAHKCSSGHSVLSVLDQ